MSADTLPGVVLDGCAGPGGWDVALGELGVGPVVGIEMDAAACLTRAAAGHVTIRADVSRYPVGQLAGKVSGAVWSPPCVVFSGAGNRGGIAVMDVLGDGIRDAFAGSATRAARRREMARALRDAGWPKPGLTGTHYGPGKRRVHLTRRERSERIWAAVRSASLVIEPARFIHACPPEWVAMEQVPEVLPLWRVYAAELGKLGYSVWCGVLNSADYGVPQTRKRAILIASRSRRVGRPVPTHYDPRKGDQLWGTPWVSMAQALGWGATGRAAPTVTAGGTATGGAEPFGHRDRDALGAERDAGHWVLHTNRDQRPDGTRQTVDPSSTPAPTLTAKSGGQWVVKAFRNNNNNNNACTRSLDEPAGTLFFGGRSNWAAWVTERPSPALVTTRRSKGGLLAGRQLPEGESRSRGGHGWDGETTSSKGGDAVRITVEEAAILQSFPRGYPWRGVKTKQFQQVGNAIPPLLAAHVLAEATGVRIAQAAA